MMQGHGGGPAFFNFTKRNHICSQSIIGDRRALEFCQLPTIESHKLIIKPLQEAQRWPGAAPPIKKK